MDNKNLIIESVESIGSRLIEISHEIHKNPEISNEEFFASNLLCEELQSHGFTIERDIAGHKTGFIATKASNKPGATIGYLAEYDALPGLGHACGHNIIGATSIGAAIALGTVIENIGGTIKVFGTPAEEGGVNGSAKASYVKAGLFNDVDVAMMIHPNSHNYTTPASLAIAPMDFEFFGKPAHAAGCPEEGINALDALLLFYSGIAALRQQLTSDVKIHGVILDGGKAANIIPDYTRARFYLRAGTVENLHILIQKVKNIAEGSALATGCTTKATHIQHVLDNLNPNPVLDDIFASTLQELGESITRSEDGIGSTDAGNVSHVIPTIHPTLSISDTTIPAHTEAFAQACISKKADDSIILGAKTLALTGFKVLTEPSLLELVKVAFESTK